jgi:hypothetical protein
LVPSNAYARILHLADADTATKDNAARTIHTWVGEKRSSAEYSDCPASRQHCDIWPFPHADEVAQQIREIARAESMPMSVLMRRWINEGIGRTRQAEREQGVGQ